MIDWFWELTLKEKRTFWACFAGWGLEGLDAQLFSFLIPALMAAIGLTRAQAGYMGTAALLAASVGGWISGILSDRYGRVRMLQISILWFCGFTALSGFANTVNQLFAARIFQGLGYGAEWSAGAVLIGEIIRAKHRGKAVGCVQAAFPLGWGAAALLSSVLLTHLPASYAWRAVFWAGLLPAVIVLYIRRNIQEPDIYVDVRAKARVDVGEKAGLGMLFRGELLGTTLLASLLALGVTGSGILLTAWLPTFLATGRHFPIAIVGSCILFAAVGGFFGYVANAYLSDGIGRRGNILIFSVCAAAMTFVYIVAPIERNVAILFPLSFVYGFFTTGIFVSLASYFTELFPTAIRARGQSFSFYLGRGVGALAISVVGVLSQTMSLGTVMGTLAIAGYLAAIVAVLLLPETKGIELASIPMPSKREPRRVVEAAKANDVRSL